jgi:hypothetical protein
LEDRIPPLTAGPRTDDEHLLLEKATALRTEADRTEAAAEPSTALRNGLPTDAPPRRRSPSMNTPQALEPRGRGTAATTVYGGDTEHDRRVRARLAELAAARGTTEQDVLAQIDRAIRDGDPLPIHEPGPSPAPDTDTRPPARVLRVRPAGGEWGVFTVASTDPRAAQPRPCAGAEPCPWRRDAPPAQFPAQAYRDSAATSQPGATSRFGCHSSTQQRPLICAGWLLRGAQHHDQVQQALADATLTLPELPDGIELYDSYQEMAVANGVDPGDPALHPNPSTPAEPEREEEYIPLNALKDPSEAAR